MSYKQRFYNLLLNGFDKWCNLAADIISGTKNEVKIWRH